MATKKVPQQEPTKQKFPIKKVPFPTLGKEILNDAVHEMYEELGDSILNYPIGDKSNRTIKEYVVKYCWGVSDPIRQRPSALDELFWGD